MNQKIRNLENDLINILNASDVSTEVKRIILGKLEAKMTILSNDQILMGEEEQNAEGVSKNNMAEPTQ